MRVGGRVFLFILNVIPLLMVADGAWAKPKTISVTASKIITFVGEAKVGKKLAYVEKNKVTYDKKNQIQQTETTYVDGKGETIAVLRADFSASTSSPAFEMLDFRTGSVHGMRYVDDKLVLFSRNSGDEEDTKVYDRDFSKDRTVYGCQGLKYYLVDNLDRVKGEKSIPVKLLIPGNSGNQEYRIVYEGESGDIVDISIEVDNWFDRIFSRPHRVKYDRTQKRIVQYQGTSNILDENGHTQNVVIQFKY